MAYELQLSVGASPGKRWDDPTLASLVGKPFALALGNTTVAGTVTYAGPDGDRDDLFLTCSHARLVVSVEERAVFESQ